MAQAERASNGKFLAKPKQPLGLNGAGNSDDNGADGENIGGVEIVNPSEITGESGAGNSKPGSDKPKRKPGRQPGFSPKKQGESKKEALDLKALNDLLYGAHVMLAIISKVPELELSKEESQKLADAAASVAVYYDIEASKKTMAWVNLSFVMGGIYGSRFITIRHNRKVEREAKNNPVTVMPPLNGGLQ